MKTNFTKSTANFGCYAENGQSRQNNFLPNENFTIEDVLHANVGIKDKAWFILYNCGFTTDEFRQFATGCSLIVLPIYENKYPDNKAPRKAIEAAQSYLDGTIEIDELRKARNAAYVAAVAAYAVNYKDLLLQFFKEFTVK